MFFSKTNNHIIFKKILFGFFFFVSLLIFKRLFKSEINWLEVISMSIVVVLVHVLFDWIEERDKYNKQENRQN